MSSKYSDDDAARLRLGVARLARHLRAVDAASSLTPTQASLLSTIVRRGPLGLSDLAAVEGIDAPTLSRAVARLEEQGLVRRRPDPSDRRAVTVEPSAPGRKLLQRLRAERNDALRARLAELGDDERRLLHDALPVLETLADALRKERARP